jgi:threonine synthase
MDPHTATCIKAYETLKDKDLKTVIYSTAEWTKFSPTVLNAINEDNNMYKDIEALEQISKKLNLKMPTSIKMLFSADIIHNKVIDIELLQQEIIDFLKQ